MDSHAEEGDIAAEEAVKVFVRIRPLNKREIGEKQTIGWDFNDTSMLEDTQNGQRVYAYDRCFGPDVTNKLTYDIVGKPVVLKAMEGYNGTVFTYGQTGSGKTWTMRGCESDPGMMILCIRDILNFVRDHAHIKYTLKVSYLEVYNEEINDLLGEPGNSNSKNLKIVSEDSVRGAVIGGLVEEVAQTPEDFMEILKRGESSRSYASTEMNNESSRSHTIYRVTIESIDIPADGSPPTSGGKVAYLNLVDLAGSERQKSTKAEGKTLKEGSNINKSLLALGAVINKLGESSKKTKGGKPVFIPYRDSKLTRILKQSLGGNTLTSMLCAVTPAPMHREETVSTLKFGQLCKSIKNSVKSNDGAVDDKTLMKQYRHTINDLKAKLEAASKGILSADPETALGQALQEKNELEAKLRSLEAAVIAGGGSLSSQAAAGAASAEALAESARLSQQCAEQTELIHVLQHQLEDFQDLEEARAAFEEYQQHSTQELDDGLAKLEDEKQSLQNERYKMLKDRSNIEEKEARIGLLITNLDEKESKLRQMMGTMKEQQDQWQRSITDLQRREDLVDDWQTNHSQREKRLQETDAMQERKFAELNKREADLASEEQKFKIAEKELKEREARLQVALSRIANSESNIAALEEKLNNNEMNLKKRETDSDIRDRELLSRRKEMESWDVLLREKDRKISTEQKQLDERENTIRNSEEKIKLKEIETEKRLNECKQNEIHINEQLEKLKKELHGVEVRNTETILEMNESKELKEELNKQFILQNEKENQLKKLEIKMLNIDQRESELNNRILQHQAVEDEFYNIKVAQITSRHSRELTRLEGIITQQLQIAAEYQKEMEALRTELAQRCAQVEDFQVAVEQRNRQIEELREHVNHFEELASAASFDSALDSAGHEDGGLSSEDEDDADSHTHHTAHAQSIAQGGGSSSRAGTTGGTVGTGGSAGHHSNPTSASPAQMALAAAQYSRRAGGQVSGQEFIIQLATTRKMLHNILEKHDAVPDKNASWGRRSQRSTPYVSPVPAAPQSRSSGAGGNNGYHSAPAAEGFHGGPGTPLVSPGYVPGGPAAASSVSAPESNWYGGADGAGTADASSRSVSPAGREGLPPPPHQFQRQNALSVQAEGAEAATMDPAGAQLEHSAPPLSPYRTGTTSAAPSSANMSPYANSGALAVAEEKDSGAQAGGSSVRSASKRNALPSTPTHSIQPGGTNSASFYTGSASGGKEKSPYPSTASPTRTSPYPPPAGSGGYSPNLSNIVKTGERRNGVPVTTVNLGYSSGIKRGMSFRDSNSSSSSSHTNNNSAHSPKHK